MNYFSLFGLPVRYQIDMHHLASVFQNLQRQYHPDKFIGNVKDERLIAQRKSAIINQAWKTLRDPLMRAEHLLSIHGFDLDKENHSMKNSIFLSKQLKLHEEFDNIKKCKSLKKLKIFTRRIKKILDIKLQKMVEQLTNEKWETALEILQELYFLNKLSNSADQFEEKLLNF